MKAVVADNPGGPEVLRVKEIAKPEPGPGEVRLQVAYAALNPLDTHARSERVSYKALGFPYIPGFEYAGVVDAVGEGVADSLIGSRCAFLGYPGGCAEYAVAPVASPHCHLFDIPTDFDWQLGTAFPCITFTAWHLLKSAGRLRAGQTVLFHGAAGNVALMGAQIAHSMGARVIGLCSSAAKAQYAQSFSPIEVINSSSGDWVEELLERTGGRGADLIIDGVAGPKAPRNFEAVAPLGQVIYLGAIAGYAPPVDISAQLYARSIAVRGFLLYVAMAETAGSENEEIHGALRDGQWRVPVERVWPLEQVSDLHRAFENRELMGRQLIRVGGDLTAP